VRKIESPAVTTGGKDVREQKNRQKTEEGPPTIVTVQVSGGRVGNWPGIFAVALAQPLSLAFGRGEAEREPILIGSVCKEDLPICLTKLSSSPVEESHLFVSQFIARFFVCPAFALLE
jgi:hypothetical protein